MKSKKADVWVSAVLYFGLGIIVISLLLAAGLPAINKLRDKNVIIQTKEVFQVLDKNIRDVVRGGPGSQRVVSVDIKKGDFKIDHNNKEIISWDYISKIAISEPGEPGNTEAPVSEGNLKIKTWREGDGFKVRIWVQYYDENSAEKSVVDLDAPDVQTISGISDLSIRNDGQGAPVTIGGNTVNRIKVTLAEIK